MLQNVNKIPIIRTLAMPKHLGPSGTIFGGWIISNMDLAGGIFAWNITNGKIRTVNCNNINFIKPVYVADLVNCYTNVLDIYKSSIKIRVDVEIYRSENKTTINAADGIFTYVAVDDNGKPREIKSIKNTKNINSNTNVIKL